jgi:hypothetical protein
MLSFYQLAKRQVLFIMIFSTPRVCSVEIFHVKKHDYVCFAACCMILNARLLLDDRENMPAAGRLNRTERSHTWYHQFRSLHQSSFLFTKRNHGRDRHSLTRIINGKTPADQILTPAQSAARSVRPARDYGPRRRLARPCPAGLGCLCEIAARFRP